MLGVTGGVAAYKSPDVVRRLRDCGAEVRVVMSANASQFITPLTMQAVSGKPVHRTLLDPTGESGMGHIELARWADLVCVAPASANFLARLAHGFADDLLSTLCLATQAQIVVVPAMNQQMWQNPCTQINVQRLLEQAVRVIGPASGDQACGEVGPGRMLEPVEIVALLNVDSASGQLTGINVLVTAGPTWEAIDPVRGLTNHSSGKMGYAVAGAAIQAGADVTLITGPTKLRPPARARVLRVTSAREMERAVRDVIDDCHIFIGVAAVSDYRPARTARDKLKKDKERLSLELVRNPDILAAVAARRNRPFTVGFAAETRDIERNARIKLRAKGADLIAANRVGNDEGFDIDTHALKLIDDNGVIDLGPATKHQLARQLIEIIAKRYHAKSPAQNTR